MAKILLIEDNPELAAGVRYNLEIEGYDVRVAEDGPAGVEVAQSFAPDLIILDLMLPGMDGFQVLRALRQRGVGIPVLVLTARGEETDKVRAFRLDADQYVTKPFGLLELLERVRILLRRSHRQTPPPDRAPPPIRFGEVEVDAAARKVSRGGAEVSITLKAFDLLLALVEREGEVLSRQELLRTVWGHRGAVLTRTVDSHISELRHKLEPDPEDPRHIHTVWKIGYRFEGG
jgi:DNA-binding response OmpR family regulator